MRDNFVFLVIFNTCDVVYNWLVSLLPSIVLDTLLCHAKTDLSIQITTLVPSTFSAFEFNAAILGKQLAEFSINSQIEFGIHFPYNNIQLSPKHRLIKIQKEHQMSSFQDLRFFVHKNPEEEVQRSYAHTVSLSCHSRRHALNSQCIVFCNSKCSICIVINL